MNAKHATKILVALSGGVDSSVCAALLKEQGYDVYGVVLKMSDAHDSTVSAAQEAADSLGIKLIIKDKRKEFEKHVIDYFVSAYKNGITPNPCVVCNPLVKFKALADTADEIGCELIATGHYAKLVKQSDGSAALYKGSSESRDQSYMLYRLDQDVLKRLIFPLGEMEKSEVRAQAQRLSLSCAAAPDSQENCFIPDNDYAGYIENRCGCSPEGNFISPEGEICGRHKGIIHYTVGQRKKLGIALGKPVFVKKIDPLKNDIYLSYLQDCFVKTAEAEELSFISGSAPEADFECEVKIRSAAKPQKASAVCENGKLIVRFDQKIKSPAKGQSMVVYKNNMLLGGGFITNSY